MRTVAAAAAAWIRRPRFAAEAVALVADTFAMVIECAWQGSFVSAAGAARVALSQIGSVEEPHA
jgi:hypothetical protein